MAKIGDRVWLVRCSDPYEELKPGTLGTVTFIDDKGTVFVDWDDGTRLGMITEAGDRFVPAPSYDVRVWREDGWWLARVVGASHASTTPVSHVTQAESEEEVPGQVRDLIATILDTGAWSFDIKILGKEE